VISELKVSDPDALVEKLTEDREYEKVIDGKTYAVLERSYAIYPQHEGELTLPAVKFEGQVITGGRSMFDIQTQYVRHFSNPLTIQVKPIPAPFTRLNWLSAEELMLTDEWSSDLSTITEGDVITRTVTLVAKGCLASQIPATPLNLPSSLKQYPEKPLSFNKAIGDDNVATVQMKVALIPNQSGKILLPEVKVRWWNTKTDSMQEAILPEATMQVAPNQVAMAEAPPLPQNELLETRTEDPSLLANIPLWALMLIGLNGVWALAFLAWLIKKVGWKVRFPKSRQCSPKTASEVKRDLKRSCLANQSKEVEKNLLLFANHLFQNSAICSLHDLKSHLPEDLKKEVEALNDFLYGQKMQMGQSEWEGKTLWQLINHFKPDQSTVDRSKKPMLNPLWD
jgi:hypothetical protein